MDKELNVILIALGHRARNGKDYTASLIKKYYPDAIILHWADALYYECENKGNSEPLIKQIKIGTPDPDIFEIHYAIMDRISDSGKALYTILSAEKVPMLHDIFTKRNITYYHGMTEKDPEILQFWGTNFRRAQEDEYWVKRVLEKVNEVGYNYTGQEPLIILIPDTRFKNELKAVKEYGGIYVRVTRLNEDGSRFYATDRDPNHPSECELEGIDGDINVVAVSGDLETLDIAAQDILATVTEVQSVTT